jgi:histidinol-phosphate aminotransferase
MQSLKKDAFRPAVLGMKGYVPASTPRDRERVVKLNTNENPYPPSPAVGKAVHVFVSPPSAFIPNPPQGVAPAVGGSLSLGRRERDGRQRFDEFLPFCSGGGGEGRCRAMPDLTYSLYPVLCAERGGRYRHPAPGRLPGDFRKYDPSARLTIFGYPNARWQPVPQAGHPGLLPQGEGFGAHHEAYADFSGDSCLDIARHHPMSW